MSHLFASGGIVDASNSSTTPLAGGATFTGAWTDLLQYASLSISGGITDAPGTLFVDFSIDGVAVSRAVQLSAASVFTPGVHALIPVYRFYRVRWVNGATPQGVFSIQAILYVQPRVALVSSRLTSTLDSSVDIINTRSVIAGANPNGVTYNEVAVSADRALNVEIVNPRAGFGSIISVDPEPRVQIDATYGLRDTDVETFTDGVSGSVTASGGQFICQTGLGVGGYGVLRSRRTLRHVAGEGSRARFDAMFTAGVANSLQAAGLFTSTDGLFFCNRNGTFGILRRIPGAAAIVRLTITVGTAGAETGTVTLNGVAFAVALGAGLTTAQVAEAIAERVGGYTGWTSSVSPQSNGATVTFIQGEPAVTAGAFTFASTGTAAGTFATIQVGAANDDSTGFVAQANWNADTMDGTSGPGNPSGVLLDPTRINAYEIVFSNQGGGTIRFRLMLPDGRMNTVHRILYPNSSTVPVARNPTWRIGWIAASLGSATNLTVRGSEAAGLTEGKIKTIRDPSAQAALFTAQTTEYVALALRVRGEFGGTVNQRETLPQELTLGVETSNRIVRCRVILNPTLTGQVNWQYVNQNNSEMEYATPTTLAPSGGQVVATASAASGAPLLLSLDDLDLRLQPGDVIALALQTASSTAVTDVGINWQEI